MSSFYSVSYNNFSAIHSPEPLQFVQDVDQLGRNKTVKSILEVAYNEYCIECLDHSKTGVDPKKFKNDFFDAINKLYKKKLICNIHVLFTIIEAAEKPLSLYHTILNAASDHYSTAPMTSYRFILEEATAHLPPRFIIILKEENEDAVLFGKYLKWHSRKALDLASGERLQELSLEKPLSMKDSPEISVIIKRVREKLDKQILWAQKHGNHIIAMPEWIRTDRFALSYCLRNVLGDFSLLYDKNYRFNLPQILDTLNSLIESVIQIHEQEKVHLGIVPENLYIYEGYPDQRILKLDGFGSLTSFGEKVYADECLYPFPEQFQEPGSLRKVFIADPKQDSYCLGWTILTCFHSYGDISTSEEYHQLKQAMFQRNDIRPEISLEPFECWILSSYSYLKNNQDNVECNILMALLGIAYQLIHVDPNKRLSVVEAQSKIRCLLESCKRDHLSEVKKLHRPLEHLWASLEIMAKASTVHVNQSLNSEDNDYIKVLVKKQLILDGRLVTNLINNGIIRKKELQITACWEMVKGQITYYKSSKRWNSAHTISTVERKSCAIVPVFHPSYSGRRGFHLIITGDRIKSGIFGKISDAVDVTVGEALFKITISKKVEGVQEKIIKQRELSVDNPRILSPKILPFTIETKQNAQKIVYYTERFSETTTVYENRIGMTKVLESCKDFMKGLSDMHDLGWVHMNIGPHALAWDSKKNLKIHYFNGLTKAGQKNHSHLLNYLPPEAFAEIQQTGVCIASIACDSYASGLTILFFLLSLKSNFTMNHYLKLITRFTEAMKINDWDSINEWYKQMYAEWQKETSSKKNMKMELLRIAYHLMNFCPKKRMKCKEAFVEIERIRKGFMLNDKKHEDFLKCLN